MSRRPPSVEQETRVLLAGSLVLAALLAGCGSDEPSSAAGDADASTGGTDATGGASGQGGSNPGGASATGGSSGATGGGSPGAGGASPSTGGTPSNAGSGGIIGGTDAGAAEDAGGSLPGFRLVWSDEFDGPAGTGPDTAKWTRETGGNGWGNNELEYYTDRTDNAAMDGQGALVITAKSEPFMGRDYTSARLKTQGHFEPVYGRIEARLDIPEGQGIWPAFWLLGNDIGSAGWPACGEIDVMENIGREPTIIHGTLHGPGYSGGNGVGESYSLPDGARFADAFHVYAVEWGTSEIRWYVDGDLYQTRTPADLPGEWVYDHPFFIIMNVAVGGQWPGNPDGTTSFPQEMKIDYVRVYEKAE
jgi:beta-glucanase (GH16 family)